MPTLGFTPVDFDVFKAEGFSQRMQQIYQHVRPKLIRLGDELAPELARRLQTSVRKWRARSRLALPN
ncbi:MAG: DUF1054 family protein [Candidatus Binataceae bacterium]